ncbi:glycosyltransferase [Aquincola sp. J276]|uniref:glycosyltransferase n=1 Tax=Aquincola sp. J276 TaxID=2898432 RepID=UPI002150E2C9|nr:glycosyltransferase [Aquincola sp. J276]MCR5868800.1 glycosyltransferase [Aquincola sp. J276]
MSRGLWISRAFPFPLDTGDRIYTGQLMKAVAEAGAQLTVVGFPARPPHMPPSDWPIRWLGVPGEPHGTARSLLSTMPLVAASHATLEYRQQIEALASEAWDFVVFDQYGMGWAMAPFLRRQSHAGAPVLVHVAHDHEASVYASLVRGFKGSKLRHLGLWQNWLKTGRIERRIVRNVDLVTAITPEDAARFAVDAPGTASVVLTPGYGGAVSNRPALHRDLPRHVVMVGNYNWVAKSENLRQFVRAADEAFHQRGITLHVIGSMSQALAAELRGSTRATVLHGFVDDVAPHFAQARLAVVPEEMGGGFKLKYLDYIFGRVPVASLTHATAGLPESIRQAMICRKGLPALVQAIVEQIDDVQALDTMQRSAFDAAQALYRWRDRGEALLAAIAAQRARRSGRAMPAPGLEAALR